MRLFVITCFSFIFVSFLDAKNVSLDLKQASSEVKTAILNYDTFLKEALKKCDLDDEEAFRKCKIDLAKKRAVLTSKQSVGYLLTHFLELQQKPLSKEFKEALSELKCQKLKQWFRKSANSWVLKNAFSARTMQEFFQISIPFKKCEIVLKSILHESKLHKKTKNLLRLEIASTTKDIITSLKLI